MSVRSRLEEAVRYTHSPDHKALLELVERVEAAKEHLSVGYPVESFQLLLVALSRITED